MASDEIIAANTKALQDLINTLTKQKGATPGEMPLSSIEGKTVKELRDEIIEQTSLENIMRQKAELEKLSQARREAIKVLQTETNKLQGEEKKQMEEQIKLLKEQEKAYARQNSAMMKVLDTSKQVLEATRIIKNTATAMLGALEKSFRTFEEIDISVFYLDNIKKGAYQIDQLNNQLQRTTGITRDVKKDIQSLVGDMDGLAISGQDAVKTFGTLQSRFNDFSRLSPQTQRELVKTSVQLERVGISAQTSAQLFQISSKVLGNSGKDATKLADDLRILAEQIQVVPQEMAQGFATAAPRLAAHGQNMKKVFQDLALQAKATGVEVNTLLGIAQGFDTFESAARKTAQLNAMFGTQLNSVQLLNAEEGERIEMIKQQLALTGRTVDMLGRFEIKSLAQILGTDDQNVRMLLRDTTDVMGELDEAIQKQGISLKDRAKALTDEDAKRRVAVERDLLYAGEKYLDVIEEVVAKQSQNAKYIREQKEALEDVVGYYKTIRDVAAMARFGISPQTTGIMSGVSIAVGTALGVGTAATGIFGLAKTKTGQRIIGDFLLNANKSGGGGPTLPPTTSPAAPAPSAPTAPRTIPGGGTPTATPGGGTPTATPRAGTAPRSSVVLKGTVPKGPIAPTVAPTAPTVAPTAPTVGPTAPTVGPTAPTIKPPTPKMFGSARLGKLAEFAGKIPGVSKVVSGLKFLGRIAGPIQAMLGVYQLYTGKTTMDFTKGYKDIFLGIGSMFSPIIAGYSFIRAIGQFTGFFDTDTMFADALFDDSDAFSKAADAYKYKIKPIGPSKPPVPTVPPPATSGDPNAMLNQANQNQSSLPPDRTMSLVINGPINAVLPEDVQDRLGKKFTGRISHENPVGTLGQGTQVITYNA